MARDSALDVSVGIIAAVVVSFAAYQAADVFTPLWEPVCGNVLVGGDVAAPVETWIQGGVACGYQAVKAIEKQRAGGDGYAEYAAWWQKSFAFNTPDFFKVVLTGSSTCLRARSAFRDR